MKSTEEKRRKFREEAERNKLEERKISPESERGFKIVKKDKNWMKNKFS